MRFVNSKSFSPEAVRQHDNRIEPYLFLAAAKYCLSRLIQTRSKASPPVGHVLTVPSPETRLKTTSPLGLLEAYCCRSSLKVRAVAPCSSMLRLGCGLRSVIARQAIASSMSLG